MNHQLENKMLINQSSVVSLSSFWLVCRPVARCLIISCRTIWWRVCCSRPNLLTWFWKWNGFPLRAEPSKPPPSYAFWLSFTVCYFLALSFTTSTEKLSLASGLPNRMILFPPQTNHFWNWKLTAPGTADEIGPVMPPRTPIAATLTAVMKSQALPPVYWTPT